MIKIGITGNIACGKSTAFEIIKSKGFHIIDCDDIVKKIYLDDDFIFETAKIFPQIVNNNKISVEKLGDLIFSDSIFKKDYENYIFPKVKEVLFRFFEEHEIEEKIFVIAPLLFEAGFEHLFDKIVFISSDENIRKERLITRNTTLSNIAEKVIKTQINEEQKKQKCDYVIKNNGTLEEFKSAVMNFLNQAFF